MTLSCLILLVVSSFSLRAQSGIQFSPKLNGNPIVLDSSYVLGESNQSIKIEVLKFYISNLELWQDSRRVYILNQKFLLIDLENPKSLIIPFEFDKTPGFNTIKFNLGIDSITNQGGALGGVLDPLKGMYWTWQSGYINVKLEGSCSLTSSTFGEFQYHLGGYRHPYNAIQTVEIKANSLGKINLNFNHFFESLDLLTSNKVMSPSEKAVLLSKRFAQLFELDQ